MPTGYTAKLYDGPQSFEDFVMSCARAMGVLIEMRDDPRDDVIPTEFKPDDYHVQALQRAEEDLAEVQALTLPEAEQICQQRFQEEIGRYKSAYVIYAEREQRFQEMKNLVASWDVPSPDHLRFQAFMQEQLATEDFDMYQEPTLRDPQEYITSQIASAQFDIKYHTKKYAEEVARAKERTQWVAALRQSLHL